MTLSASEQPARRSGRITRRLGFRIFAVSAMKWTPQKTITSASTLRGLARQLERVADEVGHLEDLGTLVVVRQDDGVAVALELLDLGDQVGNGVAALVGVARVAQPGEEGVEVGAASARLRWVRACRLPA